MKNRACGGSLFVFPLLGALQLLLTRAQVCNCVTGLLMPPSHSRAPARFFFFFAESQISCTYSSLYLWFIGVRVTSMIKFKTNSHSKFLMCFIKHYSVSCSACGSLVLLDLLMSFISSSTLLEDLLVHKVGERISVKHTVFKQEL